MNLNNPKRASFKENHLMTTARDALRTTSIYRFSTYVMNLLDPAVLSECLQSVNGIEQLYMGASNASLASECKKKYAFYIQI
jgi:hypothetical protein